MYSQEMLAKAIAEGKLRKFKPGDSSDMISLQAFARQQGYSLTQSKHRYLLKKEGAPGRPKAMTLDELMQEIDALRIAAGMQPLCADNLPKQVKPEKRAQRRHKPTGIAA